MARIAARYWAGVVVTAAVACGGGGSAGRGSGGPGPLVAPAPANWILTWSDEFDGPDGSAPDPAKWNLDVGSRRAANDALQYYTSGTENAVVRGGTLAIVATDQGASRYTCWYGTCRYTSAFLTTLGKFEQQYGRFEARIKIPTAYGLWSAFWMVGADVNDVGFPSCGEVDIMENIGRDPAMNQGSVHGPGYAYVGQYARYYLPGGDLGDDFHVYAAEWGPGVVRFYVDDAPIGTFTPADVPGEWVFDKPFFVILNLNVGGSWAFDPPASTTFPQTMLVDYVRAYTAQ